MVAVLYLDELIAELCRTADKACPLRDLRDSVEIFHDEAVIICGVVSDKPSVSFNGAEHLIAAILSIINTSIHAIVSPTEIRHVCPIGISLEVEEDIGINHILLSLIFLTLQHHRPTAHLLIVFQLSDL